MYKIFADNTLIYDSTFEDYKIGKSEITLETNKSGSFIFSIYPDHFFYDKFVKLKTVITVYKSGKIVFRGRILNDVSDHWNNKVITCEGELGFLQDSIIRPFEFSGTPEDLFKQFITEHNSQVDEFKRFKIGNCTVTDTNGRITRYSNEYANTLSALSSRTIDSTLGGYFLVTHGDNGDDPIPTIHYLSDFTKVATQSIEFGENLKQYTKTVDASDLATAIIPLGATIDDGDDATEDKRLTISDINGGKDYVYDSNGVALYGWIFQIVEFDDIIEAATLKRKAEETLRSKLAQNITIELTAIDLNLLDKSIESFCLNDYIKAVSVPHNFDETLLCNKQTLNLLRPDNDTVTLGKTYQTFTESTTKVSSHIAAIPVIQSSVNKVSNKVTELNKNVEDTSRVAETVSIDLSNATAVKLFETDEEIPNAGAIGTQTGECDISEYKRLKIFFKNLNGHLFETEIYTDKNTNVVTYLSVHFGTKFQSSELTFSNNTFTLALSVTHDITDDISFADNAVRYLSIYRIEGYKV